MTLSVRRTNVRSVVYLFTKDLRSGRGQSATLSAKDKKQILVEIRGTQIIRKFSDVQY